MAICADNIFQITGRIPQFKDSSPYHYTEGDDKKQSFLSGMVSLNTSYIPKDQKYPESCLAPFKVWGHTADYLYNFVKPGSLVRFAAEIRRDNDWEDKEGNQRRGELYLYIHDARSNKEAGEAGDAEDSKSTKSAAPKSSTVKTGARRQNPLHAKRRVI